MAIEVCKKYSRFEKSEDIWFRLLDDFLAISKAKFSKKQATHRPTL
jgi:hypothetical protein